MAIKMGKSPEAGLRIVMFAAEAAPYAKVGGLGDVVTALPRALSKLGVIPAVVVPGYRDIDYAKYNIGPCAAVPGFDMRMGSRMERVIVHQTRMSESGVEVYLTGSRKYFDRDGIYDDPATSEGFADNMERFVFFMKAGLELLSRLGTPIDIIHCHDSHAGLIPAIVRMNLRSHPLFSKVGTLFTIHNLAHQGVFPKESLDLAGISPEHFYPGSPLEYWGQVNCMKAAIELADRVNTVSRTYAEEIRTDHEIGMGLEGVLRGRGEAVSGIVNGIDYEEWDPEKDPFLPANFSVRDLSGKSRCKEHVLRQFGLPASSHRVPLIGIVSRLVNQKGFDLIEESIEKIMAMDLQMAILGLGQKRYQDLFARMASRYPEKIGVRLAYDNELAHRIEAGSDIFLMPSRFEPCGLNQLYSLRYGTIPIVRATGGLADTVIDYDRGNGTGFSFSRYSSIEMASAIRRALAAYADPAKWQELMIRGMSQDWSWDRSAAEYQNLYKEIMAPLPKL
jgi:starch synthase